jgi:undecaprenyl diphosphate synthase
MVEISKTLFSGITSKGIKPIHLAINSSGIKTWSENKKKELKECIEKHIEILNETIDLQIKNDIRVLTINLSENILEIIPFLNDFFRNLSDDQRIHQNQMRIFIIGQWYGANMDLTESFKQAMEKTKNYEQLFINFCFKYDGQEEILGAIRLIVRKILADKMKEEDLSIESIKENLYSSFFPPPDLIIETTPSYSGTLLWDSKGSLIYYTRKNWMLFDKKEFDDALSFYSKTAKTEEQ